MSVKAKAPALPAEAPAAGPSRSSTVTLRAAGLERQRGGQADDAGADHDHIRLAASMLGHRRPRPGGRQAAYFRTAPGCLDHSAYQASKSLSCAST